MADLVAAASRLAGDGGFGLRGPTTDLAREGLSRLSPWRGHPAVAATRRLAERGFGGRFPLQYALYLSTAPGLPEAIAPPELFVAAAGGRAELDAWRGALADFERAAGFFAWRSARAADFDALAASARATAGRDLEADLAAYLGLRPWDAVRVVLSPFVVPDRGAWWVVETPGREEPTAILGPRRGARPFGAAADLADDVWVEPLFTAGYLAVEACRTGLRWAPGVCDGVGDVSSPEACAQRLWVEAVLARLHERAFSVPRPATDARRLAAARFGAAAADAVAAFEAREAGDWLSWAPALLRPFTADGREPPCPIPDPARRDDPVYGALLDAARRGRAEPVAGAGPEIAADPRIDLMGLLQRLADDPVAARNPDSDAAARRFASWAGHPAVALLREMRATGFAGGAPAQYAVYLSSPPGLRETRPAPQFFAGLAGGAPRLAAWRAAAADFARVSGFLDWWRGRSARRAEELAAARAALGGRDLAAPLARYLGVRTWSSWTVVVSPFFPSGGGASWVLEERPGRPEVVVVFGPYWKKSGFWGRLTMSGGAPEEFAAGAWPEAVFSATYALFEACRPVFKPAAGACAGMPGLSNDEDCAQQTWVRGIVARLVESEFGAGAARAYREHWPPTPFQAKVDAALRSYEADRTAKADLLDAAGSLIAPFQADGAAPACRIVDRARWPEAVYARRLAYYLEARLEARPDAGLEKLRADLVEHGGKGR